MQKNYILIVLATLMVYGCGSSESNSENAKATAISYKAEIVDSVMFERFSPVSMEAFNPATNELLLFDEQQREMLVIDSDGSLISSFNPFVEGPNYMGDQSTGWTFYGRDQMIGFGYTHFYIFSKVGKRLQRMAYPIEVGGWITMDYAPKRVIAYEKNSQKAAVALLPGGIGVFNRTQAYQDSIDVVFNLDFVNGQSKPIFRKPAQSVYRKGRKYLGSGYPNMDHLGDGKFVVAYEADENIYIMDATTNELEKTIILPEPHRPIAASVAFGSKESPDLRKVVASVYGMKDQFMVSVLGKIPESEFKVLRKIPRWFESPELDQLMKKYGSMDMLLFNPSGFLGNVKWELGKIDYRYFGDSNGYIWVKRVYNDERDYQTFLKIRIVPES